MNTIQAIINVWPKMTEEQLFDKIVEFLEEQQSRLKTKVSRAFKNISNERQANHSNYIDYDKALIEAADWDMMMKDVFITMGRVDREA